ncbi:MAG: acylphosphatase [Gammaproteobacteria bacterium]|nr:acylphosphatase [Gammaproteobacteria bacterium]
MIARRCIVTGRVQGVFFRGSARSEALSLGIRGRATNLPDGSVEVIMCGPEDKLDAFCAWLKQGPRMARVEDLRCEEWSGEREFNGFETR